MSSHGSSKKMVGVAGRSASVSMAVAEQQCQRHERDNATYGNFRNDVCDFDRSGSLENRRNGAVEVEQASYYTLRRICAARVLLFAAVDFLIVMIFLAVAYRTTALTLNNLVVNFLLPVNVSCCICFRVLYSRWERSEYVAVMLCLLWVAVWTMIVVNDAVYQRIASPVWKAMLLLTFVYVVYCVRKSLTFDEKMLEDYTNEIRV